MAHGDAEIQQLLSRLGLGGFLDLSVGKKRVETAAHATKLGILLSAAASFFQRLEVVYGVGKQQSDAEQGRGCHGRTCLERPPLF